MNIEFDISVEFLDEAEKQIFEILLKQRLSFNERWSNKPTFIKIKPILRMFGLVLSIFGAMITAVSISGGANWCPFSIRPEIYITFFAISGLFFYFLPRCEVGMKNWVRNLSTKSCNKLSKKSIANARKRAPYKAEYDIKGGSVSYYREKDGELKLVWTRKLEGVAIQGDFATVIFKKWTSFIPAIVILHKDFEVVRKSLGEQKIDCRLFGDI